MIENRLSYYLAHMLEAAEQACTYVEGMDKETFLADKRTQQAVILNLVIIGEAATKLLKDHKRFIAGYPQVPWRSMKGVRNRIATAISTSIWMLFGRRWTQPFPNCCPFYLQSSRLPISRVMFDGLVIDASNHNFLKCVSC